MIYWRLPSYIHSRATYLSLPLFHTTPNITFVFPDFIFKPLASNTDFHGVIFSCRLSSHSAIKIKSSAYSNSVFPPYTYSDHLLCFGFMPYLIAYFLLNSFGYLFIPPPYLVMLWWSFCPRTYVPQFFYGSLLFMRKPFVIELRNFRGMYLGVSQASHPRRAEFQHSPILGFSCIYACTL